MRAPDAGHASAGPAAGTGKFSQVKATADKPKPQPRPGTSLRTTQPEATPAIYGINGLGVADVLQLAVPSDHDRGRTPEEIVYMNTLLEDAYTEDKRTLAPYSFAHPALERFLPVDRDGTAANGDTITVLSPAGEKTAKGRKLAETRLEPGFTMRQLQ